MSNLNKAISQVESALREKKSFELQLGIDALEGQIVTALGKGISRSDINQSLKSLPFVLGRSGLGLTDKYPYWIRGVLFEPIDSTQYEQPIGDLELKDTRRGVEQPRDIGNLVKTLEDAYELKDVSALKRGVETLSKTLKTIDLTRSEVNEQLRSTPFIMLPGGELSYREEPPYWIRGIVFDEPRGSKRRRFSDDYDEPILREEEKYKHPSRRLTPDPWEEEKGINSEEEESVIEALASGVPEDWMPEFERQAVVNQSQVHLRNLRRRDVQRYMGKGNGSLSANIRSIRRKTPEESWEPPSPTLRKNQVGLVRQSALGHLRSVNELLPTV